MAASDRHSFRRIPLCPQSMPNEPGLNIIETLEQFTRLFLDTNRGTLVIDPDFGVDPPSEWSMESGGEWNDQVGKQLASGITKYFPLLGPDIKVNCSQSGFVERGYPFYRILEIRLVGIFDRETEEPVDTKPFLVHFNFLR